MATRYTEEILTHTAEYITELSGEIYMNAEKKGFWERVEFDDKEIPLKLALIHSEVSEALEEHRMNGATEAFGEELADIIIRTLDLAAAYDFDIGQIIIDKHKKNLDRPAKHGKRY